jgi:excisionase family DNA binding protein
MENEEINEGYYSIKEFSVKLSVHENTIRRAIKSGRIVAFRVGSGKKSIYRIAHSELGRIALFDMRELIKKMINEENGGIISQETT